jgi:hypothetical protein
MKKGNSMLNILPRDTTVDPATIEPPNVPDDVREAVDQGHLAAERIAQLEEKAARLASEIARLTADLPVLASTAESDATKQKAYFTAKTKLAELRGDLERCQDALPAARAKLDEAHAALAAKRRSADRRRVERLLEQRAQNLIPMEAALETFVKHWFKDAEICDKLRASWPTPLRIGQAGAFGLVAGLDGIDAAVSAFLFKLHPFSQINSKTPPLPASNPIGHALRSVKTIPSLRQWCCDKNEYQLHVFDHGPAPIPAAEPAAPVISPELEAMHAETARAYEDANQYKRTPLERLEAGEVVSPEELLGEIPPLPPAPDYSRDPWVAECNEVFSEPRQ